MKNIFDDAVTCYLDNHLISKINYNVLFILLVFNPAFHNYFKITIDIVKNNYNVIYASVI